MAETDDGVLLSPVSQETGVAGPLPDFRQQLASDRTLLAWLRTAISLAGLGFVVAHFGLFLRHFTGLAQARTGFASGANSAVIVGRDTGIALVGLSAVVVIVGIAQHQRIAGVLSRYRQLSRAPRWPATTTAVACVVAIFSLAIYLLAGTPG